MLQIEKVRNYIHERRLLSPNARIIIGVSGGSDSVALLDILHSLGYECIVAHCNFNLRGEESFRDEYFVEQMAAKLNLKYAVTHFDTKRHVEDHSMSIEMAARELRYAWFERIRTQYEAEAIVVAHHQDDSIETVLMNLIRGTGIRGLSGIRAKNDKIVRPLLCVSHSEVLDYLREKEISFVEDSSNAEDIYRRNKIRLQVLPLLETINPSVRQAITRTSENLSQTETIYNLYFEKMKELLFRNGRISISDLQKKKAAKTILFEILNPYGFNSSTVDNIYDSIESQSGKIFYSDSHRLVRDRDSFILEENLLEGEQEIYVINETDTNLSEPMNLEIEFLTKDNDFCIEKDTNKLFIDRAKVSFPLVIRHWRHGDWFIPFGMKGKQKLSDYFSDHKFSLLDKEDAWLICSGNDIVWIVGHRSDDRFKITEETEKMIKIVLFR